LEEYVEPTKKGTPKGEEVGFSRIKYSATLLALRESVLDDGPDLKGQATELGISYGVLRKWRAEERFKEMVAKHEKEFVTYLVDGIRYNARALLGGLAEGESMLLQALRSTHKESGRKLMILLYGKVRDEALKSGATTDDLRKSQIAALDQASELLRNRASAIKHRKEVLALLSVIKKTV
jgi:hypothetical protein